MPRTATPLRAIASALVFAADKHRDQRRKDQQASPYINHPIALLNVLTVDGGVESPVVLVAAILHDTIEDTHTTREELVQQFGEDVATVVMEVTDDKALPKARRKQLQIAHAATLSPSARLVKLADKICNLRDMAVSPPHMWSAQRIQDYFDWSAAVVDPMRGTHKTLEALFDQAMAARPKRLDPT